LVLRNRPVSPSIHRQHAVRLEDIADAGRIIVKALRQLVETARSRQIDRDDFDDPSRPRSLMLLSSQANGALDLFRLSATAG
jgi:hypothetical protein